MNERILEQLTTYILLQSTFSKEKSYNPYNHMCSFNQAMIE
jgi:hypothetical protein